MYRTFYLRVKVAPEDLFQLGANFLEKGPIDDNW